MRMSEGVEWAVHVCLALDWLGGEEPMSTSRLAALYDLSPSYLNKQLQALVRAGIVSSTPGARGGFTLARAADRITLMDIVAAIEGPEDAFQCTDIVRRGLSATIPQRATPPPCAVSTAMRRAELAWRRALAAQTLADVRRSAERSTPRLGDHVRRLRQELA